MTLCLPRSLPDRSADRSLVDLNAANFHRKRRKIDTASGLGVEAEGQFPPFPSTSGLAKPGLSSRFREWTV